MDIQMDNLIDTAVDNQEQPDITNPVPGQQIGMYSRVTAQDVQQMVETLNNPEEDGQDNRG